MFNSLVENEGIPWKREGSTGEFLCRGTEKLYVEDW